MTVLAAAESSSENGQPLIPYQGCGFGLRMNLKELMGKRGPDLTGTIFV